MMNYWSFLLLVIRIRYAIWNCHGMEIERCFRRQNCGFGYEERSASVKFPTTAVRKFSTDTSALALESEQMKLC